MPTTTQLRRLASAEQTLATAQPEPAMTIPIAWLEDGRIVGRSPARPIVPGGRIDYRSGIAEEVATCANTNATKATC